MKAIESIKAQISAKFTFTINANNELPELSWVHEKTQEFRRQANEGIERMKNSGLFTQNELQEVADFAAIAIRDAAQNALTALRLMKRERYIF